MRRSALVPIITLAVFLAAAPTAQAQIGFGGGLNFDSSGDLLDVAGDEERLDAAFDNSTGWHLGVFFDAGLGPLALRPGVFYRSAGTFDFGGLPGVDDVDLSLIEVPVDLRYRVLPLPLIKPYVLLGPVFRFPQSSDSDFQDENLKNISVAGTLGLGVELSPPAMSLRIMPEIRYAFGVGSFIDEEIAVGDEDDDPFRFTADDRNLNTFMLRLNIAF